MAFENIVGKGENAGLPAFSPYPTITSTLSDTETLILQAFNLLSANALNLAQPGKLSFDNWLIFSETTNFSVFQTERNCGQQFYILVKKVERSCKD